MPIIVIIGMAATNPNRHIVIAHILPDNTLAFAPLGACLTASHAAARTDAPNPISTGTDSVITNNMNAKRTARRMNHFIYL